MLLAGYREQASRDWHWFQGLCQASCRGRKSHKDSCWAARGPWSPGGWACQVTVGRGVSTRRRASVAVENSTLDGVALLQHLTSKFTDTFHLHRFNCMHHVFLWSRVKIPIIMSHHFYSPGFCSCCLVAKSHLTLCDPMDCSSPGSSIHGISQARILEWVPISFSRGSSQTRDWTCISCVSCISGWVLFDWATREARILGNCVLSHSVVSDSLRPHGL